MSEAESDSPKPRPYGQPVEFRVAAKLESLAVIRTLVTALGTLEDLDLDAIADLRLAVDEACTRLIRCAAPDAALLVTVDPRPSELVITASAPCIGADILRPGTFSWHVIDSLTDDVQIFGDGVERDGVERDGVERDGVERDGVERDGVEVADGGRHFGIAMTARRLEPNR